MAVVASAKEAASAASAASAATLPASSPSSSPSSLPRAESASEPPSACARVQLAVGGEDEGSGVEHGTGRREAGGESALVLFESRAQSRTQRRTP